MKKLVKCIFCLLVGFCFISCASTGSDKVDAEVKKGTEVVEVSEVTEVVEEAVPEISYNLVELEPTSDNVKLLGRSILDANNQLIMGLSSTGAEFNISAKHLDIVIQGDSGANARNKNNAARVVVFVNGERKVDEMILARSVTLPVFNEAEVVEGVVQVLKVSESANSICALKKLVIDEDGKISPTEEKSLKIEFVGDSITCGYGVDDLVKEHHFSTTTEDNTKSYAYKTAKLLNADYSMVSFSGWGIISGYSGDGSKVSNMVVPEVYSKCGVAWGKSIGGICLEKTEWDFSKFKPDFIVINLGTNDASYTKSDESKIEEYKLAYIDFLKDVRQKNADAYIICALGIMGGDLMPAVETAVKEYVAQTGDSKVDSLRFQNQNMADGIAADWHPSEKTHTKAANLLVEYIKKKS